LLIRDDETGKVESIPPGADMSKPTHTPKAEEATQGDSRNGTPSHGTDEAILEEWRWFAAQRSEGAMDQYAGQYVAIQDRKVWEAGRDPGLLEKYVVREHHLDPKRLIIAYVDRV
jgi:hypothetical protein